ncbi:kinase-like protein [Gymnopus androsaceus JB14]|uniref:Kinase-like protein n=1 Tax=Gymnopus androsaceus JB14 TaxID=1447944 RepID=A0A6A4HSP9_9AGAR|nr:kinase-like protein [Gymnopus androsaceus JB14]
MNLSEIPRDPRKNNDPKQLGYWKLGRILGQGASGRVRIARHAKTGQMAAIKIIPKNLLGSRAEGLNLAGIEAERHEQSLRREVVLMKLIEHPNIMKLYDVWDLPNELFLVLEYKTIPLSQALSYFQQVILAVSYCHRFNVSHRDLKLENILVDSENNIKIADFGLAIFQPDSIVRTACGSLHYCAPEVVTGYGNYNGPMADVWSCGIILFALLTCTLPFNPENEDDLKDEILTKDVHFTDDIDPDAQDLISRMLTKDAQRRITMSEIQQHPFFLSQKPKITYGGIPSLEKIARPLKSVDDVDVELLRSLRTLCSEASDEELKDSLLNRDLNWQKGAYHLLFEYRRKRLEEYDEQVAQIERKRLKKETKARAEAEHARKAAMRPSPSSIPSRDGPPTPRRARVPMERPSHLMPSTFSEDELKPPPVANNPLLHQLFRLSPSLNPTTPKTGGTPAGVLSPNLALMQDIFKDSTMLGLGPAPVPFTPMNLGSRPRDHIDLAPPASSPPISIRFPTRPLSLKRKDTVERPKRPTINTDFSSGDKENERFLRPGTGSGAADVVKKSSLRKGGWQGLGAGKRVQILEPTCPPLEKPSKLKKKRSLRVSPLASPAPSSAASASSSSHSSPFLSPMSTGSGWFSNVFKFSKPEVFTLYSTHSVQTTRIECRRLLMAMEVRVILEDAEGLGVLRCRLDEVRDPNGILSALKAVKFKVVVRQTEEGVFLMVVS